MNKLTRVWMFGIMPIFIILIFGACVLPHAHANTPVQTVQKDTPWIVTAWKAVSQFFSNLFTSIYNGFVGVFGSINTLIGKMFGVTPDKVGKTILNFFWSIPGDVMDLAKKFWSILPFSKLSK